MGLTYIGANTFHKAGLALRDSTIQQLSLVGITQLKTRVYQKGLQAEWVYIVGEAMVECWKNQFEIAKQLGT